MDMILECCNGNNFLNRAEKGQKVKQNRVFIFSLLKNIFLDDHKKGLLQQMKTY